MAKASHGRGDVDSFFFHNNNNNSNNNLDGLGLFCILPRRPLLLTMLMMIDYHQPLSEILNSPLVSLQNWESNKRNNNSTTTTTINNNNLRLRRLLSIIHSAQARHCSLCNKCILTAVRTLHNISIC
ncbi:hypothetical protein T05_8350 [Trichinella murrelli]|uniref:Uncharacterized protein n=1 Tax=Trichinella murrelli TaxID=144512 RepID=A0A0V0TBV7_9BILA|nr:hypothetical protein T05_8350 [Trichinella murrelli]